MEFEKYYKMRLTGISEYLKNILLICLFAWISFFPSSVHNLYGNFEIIFLGVFLLILILLKKSARSIFSLKDWRLWLFSVCLLAGTVNAIDKNLAYKTYFEIIFIFAFLYYIGKALLVTEGNDNKISVIICLGSLIVAFIGLLELYFGKNILYENFLRNNYYQRYILVGRPMSTQFNPVILGTYLLGCFPFGFILLKNKLSFLRLLGITSLFISAFVIILTFSRGVFLGFMSMIIFWLWQEHKKKLLKVFVVLSVAAIVFCSFQENDNFKRFGFQRFIAGSGDSIFSQYRSERIKMTFKMLKDHPFLGIGLNHFRFRFSEYCNKSDVNEIYEFRIPDSMYLTFLAETGLIGMCGFLLFIIFLFKAGLKEVKKQPIEARQILLASLAALVGFLVNMGAYDLFYWRNPLMLFCLICGFIASSRVTQR